MDKIFFELLETTPMRVITENTKNADRLITEEEKEKISIIGELYKEAYDKIKKMKKSQEANKLDKIEEIQDKCYKEQCRIMRDLLDERDKVTIPLLYRKAIFFIAYCLSASMKEENNSLSGIQKRVLDDLKLTKKTFQGWGMRPTEDYEEGNYEYEKIGLKRYGKKNDKLLFVFDTIISYVKYKNFVDVFAGTGAVTVSKYKRKGTKEYLNDSDKVVSNFLWVLKLEPEKLEERCKEIFKEIETQPKGKIFEDGKEAYKERIRRKEEELYKAQSFSDFELFDELEEKINLLYDDENIGKIQYAMGLQKFFKSEIKTYKEVNKNNILTINDMNIEIALAYYYIHSFTFNHNTSITGVTWSNIKRFEKNIQTILRYSERLKEVDEIKCVDFRKIIKAFDSEDTLLYLDSPYYRTTQYDETFSDRDHIDLHESLKNFKGKWIFSCRSKLPKNIKKTKEVLIESLEQYFAMYSDIGKYVVYDETDKNKEIMITNFDFVTPKLQTFKSLNGVKVKENEIDECFIKETYSQFLSKFKSEESFRNRILKNYLMKEQ